MTNERAIELLNRISDSQFDGEYGDERREALEMAVMALEQNLVQESDSLVKDLVKDCISRKAAIEAFEPEHHTDWYTPTIIETLEALPSAQPETHDKRTETHMCDLISRQAAIDAIKSYWKNEVDRIPKKSTNYDVFTQICDSILSHNANICKAIDKLPSAQPEQKKGKWERVYFDHVASGERPSIFYCSSCNQCVPFPTNFCPACGSDNRQR